MVAEETELSEIPKMEAGEIEIRKAFEEVSTKNIKAMLEHGNETRRMLRELEEKVSRQDETIRNQNTTIEAIRLQLSQVQGIVYGGGT